MSVKTRPPTRDAVYLVLPKVQGTRFVTKVVLTLKMWEVVGVETWYRRTGPQRLLRFCLQLLGSEHL